MLGRSQFLVFVILVLGLAGSAGADLVARWKLDEGSGTIAADSIGNGYDGVLMNGPVWVKGIQGGALDFDNVDDYVDIPNSEGWPVGTEPRSMCAWAMPASTVSGEWNWIMSYGTASTGHAMFIGGQGTLLIGAGYGDRIDLADFWVVGEWHHITLTYDGSTALLYADGVQVVSGQKNWDLTPNRAHIGMQVNDLMEMWDGLIDDVRLYNHVLSPAEVNKAMRGDVELSFDPSPEDGETDVLLDTVLSWSAGAVAVTHDVYLGTSFEDVNAATRANPLGVLVSEGQMGTTYDASGALAYDQTYYWRVDEVNGAPDFTIFPGTVWSFTTEPFAYPVADVVATSNGIPEDDKGPENTVNGSGLNADGQHSVETSAMWEAAPVEGEPLYIQFEFARVYKLHQMLVWNYNGEFEMMLGFGIKGATVEYSENSADWTLLGEVELAQATARDDYTANTTIDFDGAAVKAVRLTVQSGYGMMGTFGLSEVQFLYLPVQASKPQPDMGTTGVSVATDLTWRAGREAVTHEVLLSIDEAAVAEGTAAAATATDSALTPEDLNLATTYYWKVNEVNEAEAISLWEGDIWNFSTEEYLVVDDFESYDGEENLVFDVWIDGWTNETGSTVGYLESPYIERAITHDGGKSMPLAYDHTGGVTLSEATRTFDEPQDWTGHGIKGLILWFYGDLSNATDQMYVKINDTKALYDGDADNITWKPWQLWYVDLAALAGADLTAVTELTIGFEGSGTGLVLIDDIMLSPYERRLVTPVDPGTTNLVSHYAFEGDTSDSTGAHPGTPAGSPDFVPGKVGQAVTLNGTGDYIELTGYTGILGASAITAAAWINTVSTETGAILGWGPNVAGQRFGFRINEGRLRFEHHGGNVQGDTSVNDGAWHHVAVTIQENATISHPEVILWLDGRDDTLPTTDPDAFNITAALDARIGSRPASNDRFFMGEIDELYIYDRALSPGEIAWMAGRTASFDLPSTGQ